MILCSIVRATQLAAQDFSFCSRIKRPCAILAQIIALFIWAGIPENAYAQNFVEVAKPKPIVCYSSGIEAHSHINPPVAYLNKKKLGTGARTTASSHFEVTYIGFTNEAKQAFQRAVDIWESVLVTPVTIRIEAQWTDLSNIDGDEGSSGNILGQAGATAIYVKPEFPKAATFYPVALAEKLAGRDLNGTDNPDIQASFNSKNSNWYYGTDGKTPRGQIDLVSVVLHEIGHGLGFSGSMSVNNETKMGSWGQSSFPYVYDHFVVNAANQPLIDTSLFKNPSASLKTQLTSGKLFFDSPLARKVNVGQNPQLYAPSTYNRGSSIAHLNESTYLSGSPNSLMTPQIGNSEAIHDPGPLLLNMLAEMGWRATNIRHEPIKDIENTANPIVFKAIITSDDLLTAGSPLLHYAAGPITNEATVAMKPTGNLNEYAAQIPSPGANKIVTYYLSATDSTKRLFTNPGEAPSYYYTFFVGTDTISPTIGHAPLEPVFVDYDSISLAATISDNRGIATAYVEYTINGLAQPSFALNLLDAESNRYAGKFPRLKGALKAGDQISYRIIAVDISARANQKTSPVKEYYTFKIIQIAPAQVSYANQFNTPSEDFAGSSFSIITPSGFSNGAIHSEHPYQNGSGANFESNYIYQLLIPIIVRSENASVRFDEIVLVEPGEEGAAFGTPEFFDYVVVEGSTNKGKSWMPIADGYDSRYKANWLTAYNKSLAQEGEAENSKTEGTPALYRFHSMDLLNTFSAGDTVLIRFRLFADQLSHGWGWAIDNLEIQGGAITGADEVAKRELTVFPNPTQGDVTVRAQLGQSFGQVTLSVINPLGSLVFEKMYPGGPSFNKNINLGHLSPGLYLINIQTGTQKLTRKVFVVN